MGVGFFFLRLLRFGLEYFGIFGRFVALTWWGFCDYFGVHFWFLICFFDFQDIFGVFVTFSRLVVVGSWVSILIDVAIDE